MGSSDVVNVWAWVTVGVAAPCWCLLAPEDMSEGGVSNKQVVALCGCVSCGLCVPLMWSVCGRVLLWALRPFAGVYWLVGVVEGVYVSNEWSGHGSFMGVSLIVCGCL